MLRRFALVLIATLALVLPVLAASTAAQEPEWEIPQDAEQVELVRIIDGDTFDVELINSGREERIRMIGIDTPETNDSFGNEPECYGEEATRRAESILVSADEIWVSEDIDPEDDFDRLLRYVWYISPIDDEVHFLNRELVAEGYALAKTYRPNTQYQDELDDAEEVAISEGRGMWLTCDASVSMDPDQETDGRPDDEPIDRTLTPVEDDEEAVCSFFFNFDEAQDFLDEYPDLADLLDPDGDGLACEGYFGVE